MEISMYIILILAAAMVMIPVWGELVRLVGHLGVNYDGKQIPQSMGAVFPLIFLVAALWATATEMLTFGLIWRALVITIGLGTLGLVDDIWGDQQVKGIRGHFSKLLLRGEVTTGLLKAV
ncbi:MAG: hypothetical protein NUK65_05060, partial [Firmicutes bacterium]|nr:hypothetical protein [Bacillota bacterium]